LNDETMKGLTSEAIIAELVKKPDRPWADWKSGKAITPKALAGLLKPFGIFPHQLSVGDGKELRGYARHDAAGVPRTVWNMHARHGGATEAQQAGVNLADIAEHAQHTDINTTRKHRALG
jgi:hypothetical protein